MKLKEKNKRNYLEYKSSIKYIDNDNNQDNSDFEKELLKKI